MRIIEKILVLILTSVMTINVWHVDIDTQDESHEVIEYYIADIGPETETAQGEISIDMTPILWCDEDLKNYIAEYLRNTCETCGYSGCKVFDYVKNEDDIFLHLNYDDALYQGISVKLDCSLIKKIYNATITENLLKCWE